MNVEQRKFYRRFSQFAVKCSKLVRKLDWKIQSNKPWGIQLLRSAGSFGANFIEAAEAISARDFIHRYRTCRKGACETMHWLYLLRETNSDALRLEMDALIKEVREFIKIFSKSIKTAEKSAEKE